MAPRPGPGRQPPSFADQLAVGVADQPARAAPVVDPGRLPAAIRPLARRRQDAAVRLAVAARLLPAAARQLVAAAFAAQVAVVVADAAFAALAQVDRAVAPVAVGALAIGVERAIARGTVTAALVPAAVRQPAAIALADQVAVVVGDPLVDALFV